MISREIAIRHHLGHNHFPPVPQDFDESALEAIDKASVGDWDESITLPNGAVLPVHRIVEELHLDFFIESEDEG